MRIAAGIIVAVATALAHTQAASAGVVVVIPPLEVEVGRATTLAPNQRAASEPQILIGLSWASVFPGRTPFDVSVGLVVIGEDEDEDPPAGTAARAVPAQGPTTGWFVAAELRAVEGKHWRSWLGARAERLNLGDEVGLGGFARMSTEVWFGAAGSDGQGVIFGAPAITLWAEAGLRERASGSVSPVVAAGMGVRIPFLFFGGR